MIWALLRVPIKNIVNVKRVGKSKRRKSKRKIRNLKGWKCKIIHIV
jgi:hypothetical protein